MYKSHSAAIILCIGFKKSICFIQEKIHRKQKKGKKMFGRPSLLNTHARYNYNNGVLCSAARLRAAQWAYACRNRRRNRAMSSLTFWPSR